MDHFLAPCHDILEILLSDIDFSWFTDGSYLKGNDGANTVLYAVISSFHVVEVASLSMATLTQEPELYPSIWACTLANDKATIIYNDHK